VKVIDFLVHSDQLLALLARCIVHDARCSSFVVRVFVAMFCCQGTRRGRYVMYARPL
jgi:hypothetical protein